MPLLVIRTEADGCARPGLPIGAVEGRAGRAGSAGLHGGKCVGVGWGGVGWGGVSSSERALFLSSVTPEADEQPDLLFVTSCFTFGSEGKCFLCRSIRGRGVSAGETKRV